MVIEIFFLPLRLITHNAILSTNYWVFGFWHHFATKVSTVKMIQKHENPSKLTQNPCVIGLRLFNLEELKHKGVILK